MGRGYQLHRLAENYSQRYRWQRIAGPGMRPANSMKIVCEQESLVSAYDQRKFIFLLRIVYRDARFSPSICG